MRYRTDEATIERESIEHVFGLTGGELNDKPLTVEKDWGKLR